MLTAYDRRELAGIGIAFLGYVVGDLATTIYGISVYPNIHESNIIPLMMIDYMGLYSLIPYKVVIFGVFAYLYIKMPKPYCYGIMIGLCVVGIIVTIYNSILIFG